MTNIHLSILVPLTLVGGTAFAQAHFPARALDSALTRFSTVDAPQLAQSLKSIQVDTTAVDATEVKVTLTSTANASVVYDCKQVDVITGTVGATVEATVQCALADASNIPILVSTLRPTAVPALSLEATSTPSRFAAARTVLDHSCFRCHGSEWSALDEAGYVREGLVKAGSPQTSKLFQRIRGAGPHGDMPRRAPDLSAADIQTLRNWIQQIQH